MSLDNYTLNYVVRIVEDKLDTYQHNRKRCEELEQPNMAISANGSVIACYAILASLTGEPVWDLLKKYEDKME